MRYYKIEITDSDGAAFSTYTSYPNGTNDPGALQVELDIPVAAYATPLGGAMVRIWGVSLQTIGQASDLNGKSVKVFGGMQKGLPLANPDQAGLLVDGVINQAFGNWIGTSQTLDLVIIANTGSPDDPKNVTLNWKKGAQLADAVRSTLQTAFPGFSIGINISNKLVSSQDQAGYYQSISQFAEWLKSTSQAIVGGNYPGVEIALRERSIIVYDGTVQSSPTQIAFTDLIGQPTWIDQATVQLNCVMRADLQIGDYVKFPPAQVTTTAASLSQFRDRSVFQGTFLVAFIRHVGSFRQPDASAWITTIDAKVMNQS